MRRTASRDSYSSREPAPEPLPQEEQELGKRSLVAVIKNAPWVAIAAVFHILLIAIASVIYVSMERSKASDGQIEVSVARPRVEVPEVQLPPPELIDREAIPAPSEEEEGIVNPDEHYIPDAAAGRQGEVTLETDPTKPPGIFNPDPEALKDLPSGATGGTAMGVGAVGHFGNGVSAFSSRVAGGGGAGGGGLGQGGGGGRGGTKKTEEAVLAALEWLAKHQSPDGSWDCDGFEAQCKKGLCGGKGSGPFDPGVTGLALLCFLGAGHTHLEGKFKENVKNGLRYLLNVQDPEGCFGTRTSQQFVYNHACAALAMVEAYGMTKAKAFKAPAQNGIGFIQRARNPYLAWRYGIQDGNNDSSVTGWNIMVLKSGILAGLDTDPGAMKGGLDWIEQMTDPVYGRTGYVRQGSGPARFEGKQEAFPSEKSESLTAAGILVRIFAGNSPETDPAINKGCELMMLNLPKWDPKGGTIDMYYWYYATLALHQVGGTYWTKWNEAMKTAIVDSQIRDKNDDRYGSWDPIDPWGPEGGRIYSTAVNCLCVEVYYRYPRVFGTDPKKAGGSKPSLPTDPNKPQK